MAKYYGVALVATSGFGEYEQSIYGGDHGRTIKDTLRKATGDEYDPERHSAYLLGRDNIEETDATDIRGLVCDEPQRVYAVETMYGIRYVGLDKI